MVYVRKVIANKTILPIGEPIDESFRPRSYKLQLSDHLPDIDPTTFKIRPLPDIDLIDPNSYFITSGDALEKAKQLEKDLWVLGGQLQRELTLRPSKKTKLYSSAVWKCAGASRALVNKLRKAKGPDTFLETEWNIDRELILIPKNPRVPQKHHKDRRPKLTQTSKSY